MCRQTTSTTYDFDKKEYCNHGYTQDRVVQDGLNLKHTFFTAFDNEKGGGKKEYISFINKDYYLNFYSNIPKESKCFYEILLPNQGRYNYYDIDVESDNRYFDYGEQGVLDKFLEQYYNYNTNIDKNKIFITNSSTNKKISFHIVDKNTYFNNLEEQRDYLKKYEERFTYIIYDKSVYEPYKLMRLIGNSKRGKNVFLQPHEHHKPSVNAKYEDFFITGKIDHSIPFINTKDYNEKTKPKKKFDARDACTRPTGDYQIKNEEKNNSTLPDEEKKSPEQILSIMKDLSSFFPNMYEDYTECFKSICVFYNSYTIYGGRERKWLGVCDEFCSQSKGKYNSDWVDEEWEKAKKYSGTPIKLWSYIGQLKDHLVNNKSQYIDFLRRNPDFFKKKDLLPEKVEYEYESDYNFSTFQRDIISRGPWTDYDALLNFILENLNRVCVIVPYGKNKFMCKNSDKYLKEIDVNFKVRYYQGEGEKKKVVKTLFTDFIEDNMNYIKTFDKVCMIPLPAGTPRKNEKIFNTWLGYTNDLFEYKEEIDMTYVEPFLKLVRHIVSNNEELYNYFLAYFQHLIKHPYNKIETQLVITGKQGTGKTLIMKVISAMFHQSHTFQTSDLDYVVGQFNSIVENCILAVMNDVADYTAASGKMWSKMKSLTTEVNTIGRRMFSDPSPMNTYVNFVFTSNNPTPTKVEDGDRRNVMPEYITNKLSPSIYKFIDEELVYKKEIRDHLFNYLYYLDTDINLRVIPETEARKSAIEEGKPVHMRFLDYFKTIQDKNFFLKHNDKFYISENGLFEVFKDWALTNNEKTNHLTARKLTNKIKMFLGDKEKIDNRNYYCVF